MEKHPIARRFRGFLPVVVDVETAGFNPTRDALLELAVVLLKINAEGRWQRDVTHACHVAPFPGANLEQSSLEFTGIDPFHPFRMALAEPEALQSVFEPINKALKKYHCTRAILVGHNPTFDLSFVQAASRRCKIKKTPFHMFSTFDTATLGGLAFGQTVLAKAAEAAGILWDNRQAHSAIYDAERTADLFCAIVNRWDEVVFPMHGFGVQLREESDA
jgi:ribonuclease T